MLRSLSAFLYRIASWKTLLLALALYISFPAYVFKTLEERMNTAAGKPVGPIDLLVGYDPARIEQMVAAYGPEGRAVYARGELTADLAYPFVYTFLFCLILSLLFRNRPYAPFRLVNVLPLGIALFDLCENACIVYLLKTYPAPSPVVASLCSVFTNLKWLLTAVTLALTGYGLIRLFVKPMKLAQILLPALLLNCAALASTNAQTTPSKPGSLADVALLEGHWLGTFNGGPIEAAWTAPVSDNIVGYIRMMKDNKPALYEMFVFEQTERGPLAMVKHFKPGLIGVEEKDKSDRYRFVSAEKDRALFEKEDGTIRIIYERRSPTQLVIQRGQSKDGQWSFSDLFVFERVK